MRGQGKKVGKRLYWERSRLPRRRDSHNMQKGNCYCGERGEKKKKRNLRWEEEKKEEEIKKRKIV